MNIRIHRLQLKLTIITSQTIKRIPNQTNRQILMPHLIPNLILKLHMHNLPKRNKPNPHTLHLSRLSPPLTHRPPNKTPQSTRLCNSSKTSSNDPNLTNTHNPSKTIFY